MIVVKELEREGGEGISRCLCGGGGNARLTAEETGSCDEVFIL